MDTEIAKLYENDAFLNKRLMYIALSLMSAEIQTKVLKEKGFIAEKQYSRFSKDINKLRKKYKDLFNNLLETDTSYIW